VLHRGGRPNAHYHRAVLALRRPTAQVLAAVLLTLSAVGCGQTDAGGQSPFRLLFVGNSLTATNDLPAAVAAIAAHVGSRPVEFRTVAPGGVSLEEHWRSTGARDLLASGDWDAVVLQQGPSSLPESRAHLRSWTKRWADEVRAHGARPALLMVWPEAERSSAFTAVIDSYAAAAAASRAELLPVGAAWRVALRRDPNLGLYGPDGFHPSELGTYLTALVVYSRLTGTPASTLPSAIEWDGRRVSLPERTAHVLREAVAQAD
jgi:hypothetical protein